ncbi:hypothetical protein EDD17DRAFT_1576054 [Pisolithus thermaeus]|nr:hypothetical protein EDD17DRAFT_1576054 [Pisolithus thermaeus]
MMTMAPDSGDRSRTPLVLLYMVVLLLTSALPRPANFARVVKRWWVPLCRAHLGPSNLFSIVLVSSDSLVYTHRTGYRKGRNHTKRTPPPSKGETTAADFWCVAEIPPVQWYHRDRSTRPCAQSIIHTTTISDHGGAVPMQHDTIEGTRPSGRVQEGVEVLACTYRRRGRSGGREDL